MKRPLGLDITGLTGMAKCARDLSGVVAIN